MIWAVQWSLAFLLSDFGIHPKTFTLNARRSKNKRTKMRGKKWHHKTLPFSSTPPLPQIVKVAAYTLRIQRRIEYRVISRARRHLHLPSLLPGAFVVRALSNLLVVSPEFWLGHILNSNVSIFIFTFKSTLRSTARFAFECNFNCIGGRPLEFECHIRPRLQRFLRVGNVGETV